MAPKEKAEKKKDGDGLRRALQAIKPLVTEEEIASARAAMEDAAVMKKVRSNMSHALKQKGVYDAYMEAPMPERRGFLETYCANELKSNPKVRLLLKQLTYKSC